jgi:hypothetical protein
MADGMRVAAAVAIVAAVASYIALRRPTRVFTPADPSPTPIAPAASPALAANASSTPTATLTPTTAPVPACAD